MKTLFPEIKSITDSVRRRLKTLNLVNTDGTVVSWSRLSPSLRDRKVTNHVAKQLITIEANAKSPREEILNRLVNYIVSANKKDLIKKISKLKNNEQ